MISRPMSGGEVTHEGAGATDKPAATAVERHVPAWPCQRRGDVARLAVQRAGGVPAPMGVFEDAARLAGAARLIDAVASLTVARFAGIATAERAREAAAAHIGIRFVAAFGEGLPEGVAGLDNWDQVEFLGKTSFPRLTGTSPALISFDRCSIPAPSVPSWATARKPPLSCPVLRQRHGSTIARAERSERKALC